MNDMMFKTTINHPTLHEHVSDNDIADAFVTPAADYSGAHGPAPGHTAESERGWNDWWQANFRIAMEHNIVPAVGDALGMKSLELRTEIRDLRDRVTKLERELEQARADNVVTLPRSAWRHNAA